MSESRISRLERVVVALIDGRRLDEHCADDVRDLRCACGRAGSHDKADAANAGNRKGK